MAGYFDPPDQTGLVLNDGDMLAVKKYGSATGTTIKAGGSPDRSPPR
jgi:hypothetical protein